MQKIRERNTALSLFSRDRTNQELHEKAKQARKRLKNAIRRAKEKWLRTEAEAMNDDPTTAWKAAKEIASGMYYHHKPAISMKMRKRDGTLAQTDLETKHPKQKVV